MRYLLLTLLLCLVLPAQSRVTHDLKDNSVIATVDGYSFPAKTVTDMYKLVLRKQPELSKQSFLQGLIENHLFAQKALQEKSLDQWMEGTKVGFSGTVAVEDQYISHLRTIFIKELTDNINSLPNQDLSSFVTGHYETTKNKSSLDDALKLTDFMEYKLTDEQADKARQIRLIEFQFPGAEKAAVTLFDVYSRQNVQGKVRLHDVEVEYIQALAQQRYASLYVLHWTKLHSGYSQEELGALYKIVRDKNIKEHYLPSLGVFVDIHDSNQHLKDLQEKVTKKQIKAYYKEHKDEFMVVDRVRARHIECPDEATCKKAHKALESGTSFKDAVLKYSSAESKNSKEPGSLGWIRRQSKDLPWLSQVALIQRAGIPTRPIRSPQHGGAKIVWQIIYVDERIEEALPLDSETVSYVARQAIAKKMAAENFREMKAGLFNKADIHLNMEVINQPVKLPEQDQQYSKPPKQEDHRGHGHGHGHSH